MALSGNVKKGLVTLAVMAVSFAVARPYVAYLLYRRAGDYMSAMMVPDAARSYQKSLIFDGRDADARAWLAYCYTLMGRSDEALVQYGKVVEQDPDNVMAYFDMGVIYRKMDRTETAREMFLKGRDCRQSRYTADANYRFYTRSCLHMLEIIDKDAADPQ